MTELQATKTGRSSSANAAVGRLFVLELNAGRIHLMNPDGSDKKTIVTIAVYPMVSPSMWKPVTSTGPTWVFPT